MSITSLSLVLIWVPGFSAQLSLGAQSSNEVGTVSLQPGADPQPVVNLSVIPSFALGLGVDNHNVGINYSFRMLQRIALDPSDSEAFDATLYFHNFSLGANHRFSNGWAMSEGFAASLGLADFATAGLVAVGDATDPDSTATAGRGGSAESVWLLGTNGTVSLSTNIVKGWAFSVGAQVGWNGPITGSTGAQSAFVETLTYTANGSLSWSPAARQAISLVVEAGWADSPLMGLFRTISSSLGYSYSLGRDTAVSLQAGLAIIEPLETSSTAMTVTQNLQVNPVGSVQMSTVLYRVREVQIQMSMGGSVSATPNPLRGITELIGTANLGLFINLPPYWSVGMEAAFTSPVGCDEGGQDCAPPRQDGLLETCASDASTRSDLTCQEASWSLSVPVDFRWQSDFALQFGARVVALGPRVQAPGALDFVSVSVLGYLGLSFTTENQL